MASVRRSVAPLALAALCLSLAAAAKPALAQTSPFEAGLTATADPAALAKSYAEYLATPAGAESQGPIQQLRAMYGDAFTLVEGAHRVHAHLGMRVGMVLELTFKQAAPPPLAQLTGEVQPLPGKVAGKPMFGFRRGASYFVGGDVRALRAAATSKVSRKVDLPFPKGRLAVAAVQFFPGAGRVPDIAFVVDEAGGRLLMKSINDKVDQGMLDRFQAMQADAKRSGLTAEAVRRDGFVQLDLRGPGMAALGTFAAITLPAVMRVQKRIREAEGKAQ